MFFLKRTQVVTPVLTTPRLRLRPVALYDAPDIQHSFPHWDIVRYLDRRDVPWPYPEGEAARHLRETVLPDMKTGRRHAWALTRRGALDDALIGVVELLPDHPKDNRLFWLAPAWQGRGVMTEACFAVTDFAFFTLKRPELLLVTAEANLPSVRLKERSGAVRVQRGEHDFLAGRLPVSRWVLTRTAWESHRDAVWTYLAHKVRTTPSPVVNLRQARA